MKKGVPMKGDELQERLVEFAGSIMAICASLPKSFEGRHIAEQMFRSATSAAANYAEVRGAESQRDFVHKLGVVRKELNETQVWIRLCLKGALSGTALLDSTLNECLQLRSIISASRKTAEQHLTKH
jgi:four helix bundle protein